MRIASSFGAIYRARGLIASQSGENEAQPRSRWGLLPGASGSRISLGRDDLRAHDRRTARAGGLRLVSRPLPLQAYKIHTFPGNGTGDK